MTQTPRLRSRPQPAAGTPEMPKGRVVLCPPPERPDSDGAAGALLNVVPMLGSLGSLVLVSSMGGENRARGLVAAGLILFATVGFVLVQADRQRTQRARRATGSRAAYLRHLERVRAAARSAARQQRAALTHRHPDPSALPAVAEERSRLWPGTAGPAPLPVRFGLSPQPLALELVPPGEDGTGGRESGGAGQAGPVDPAAAAALSRLLAVHRVAPDLPATVDLRSFDRIELCGEEAPAQSLARALICSATSGHAPDRLTVAVLCGRAARPHWDWVKWLPHARSARTGDAVGGARLVATDFDDLVALLPETHPDGPHLLLVVDAAEPPDHRLVSADGARDATVLHLPAGWGALQEPTRLRLELLGRRAQANGREAVLALRPGEAPGAALADRCSPATAEAFARRLAPLFPAGETRAGAAGGGSSPATDVAELLDLGDLRGPQPARQGTVRPEVERLRVPIGVADDGSPVHLDLKEAAQQGMGPHGLVVGATGSGKSELLRTLCLGLATRHSPEELTLVLVDFKGGATFAGLSDLPHVSAVITNLEAELTLVDRMQDALSGEMVRRQELLRAAGNHASVRDYEKARAAGADLEPLPSLLIVVDEFSEMLSAKPEFIDLFVAIGRLGRSLGLHLLLASQRLEEGRLRGLESHLSYRIGLRTFSAGESRTVLGVPDAATLPSTPGVGFLRSDPAALVRFRAACASGAPRQEAAPRTDADEPSGGILPFSVAAVPACGPAASGEPRVPATGTAEQGPSVLDLAVRRMAGRAPRARRIWLAPLGRPDTLGELMPDLEADPTLGLVSQRWRDRGPLVVPVGTVDRPREQRRETLAVDLRGSGGHVAVVGAPRSGKSTLLASTVGGLALTSTPLEAQVLVLDFGGGTCAALADLPHVAGVATRADPEVVRRTVAEATGVLERREASFGEQGIDSLQTYRERRARGEADDGWGDVFVVVDGWSTLCADFGEAAGQLERLAATGLTYGVHLLVAATRWADLRPGVRDLFGTRLELRLGDPLDSEVDRRTAARVPAGRPGRGLTQDSHHLLGALPALGQPAGPASSGDGLADLVGRVAGSWHGARGPTVRLLPTRIDLVDVRRRAGAVDQGLLLLGLEERELAPVCLDPDREPHLLVLGDGGSGKTAALRTYAHEVMRSRTTAEAQLVVVDYRRTLLGEVPSEYLLDHLTSASLAGPALGDLAAHLEERLPGRGVTPQELRTRSWWTGPDVFVLVDDHDLVATARDSPLTALEHLLPQARDVGLHVVVARRSGGASRALHEPVLQSLRDLAMPGLLLSGSPEEGRLLGSLRPEPAAPGRARLLTRDRGAEVLQLAWCGAAGAESTPAPRVDPSGRGPSGAVARRSRPCGETATDGGRKSLH